LANNSQVSYFKHAFGQPDQPADPSSTQTQAHSLSEEWEALEQRLKSATPQEGHHQVSDFLRRWGVALAQAAPATQGPLANLLESARASLLGQLALANDQNRTTQYQQTEVRQRQAADQAAHQRRMGAGQAEIRRLREETARIQADTWSASQRAADRNHQLAKAALFPEQHCPYCSRAYLDLTGGCWHCQHHHRPGHF
jgi:hypothetical protein